MSAGVWVQAIATVILVIITGLYVRETRQMVKSMEREREEMHRPILVFQMMYWWSSMELVLRIQNIGSGGAVDVEGTIESRLKGGGQVLFPWSRKLLCAGEYQELNVPMPEGTREEDRFRVERMQEGVVDVRAKLKYKSGLGVEYKLDDTKAIEKVTKSIVQGRVSRELVHKDDRRQVMSRIAGALEEIADHLRSLRQGTEIEKKEKKQEKEDIYNNTL